MNQSELNIVAVMSVSALEMLKPIEVGVMQMANAYLQKSGYIIMNDDEFNAAMKESKNYSIIQKDGKSFLKKNRKERLTKSRRLKSLNGKVLHLFDGAIFDETGDIFAIEYNIDGRGGIRLEDGTVTHETLAKLGERLWIKSGIKHGRGNKANNTWQIDSTKHPEVPADKFVTIKDYIEKYIVS